MERKKKDILSIVATQLGFIITILTSLWFIGEPFLEDYVNARIDNRVSSPETLQKAFKSPYFLDYQKNQKREWTEQELHKTDNRVKFSSSLVSKTGMNKEAMGDTLAAMIKRNNLGTPYVTSEQCVFNSKKYGRARNQMMRN